MEKELEYKIRDNFSEALERFDFSKVYDVMRYLGWTWCGERHSPSLIQMITTVKELFRIAVEDFNGSERWISTGGFTVIISEKGKVRIQFIVEESYSYDRE
jgi:cell division protein FtsW (lipid II flippase)